jgi:hypothetical protein
MEEKQIMLCPRVFIFQEAESNKILQLSKEFSTVCPF